MREASTRSAWRSYRDEDGGYVSEQLGGDGTARCCAEPPENKYQHGGGLHLDCQEGTIENSAGADTEGRKEPLTWFNYGSEFR